MEKRFKYKEYIEIPKSKSYKGPHYVWQETDENNNILEEGLKLWVAEQDAKLKSSSYKNSYAQEPFNSTELCVFSARKDSET